MSGWSVVWAVLVLLFVVADVVAARSGFWSTFTGHGVALMRASPWAMVLVPTFFFGVGVHFIVEALRQ